jgi:hypothetical protein
MTPFPNTDILLQKSIWYVFHLQDKFQISRVICAGAICLQLWLGLLVLAN